MGADSWQSRRYAERLSSSPLGHFARRDFTDAKAIPNAAVHILLPLGPHCIWWALHGRLYPRNGSGKEALA